MSNDPDPIVREPRKDLVRTARIGSEAEGTSKPGLSWWVGKYLLGWAHALCLVDRGPKCIPAFPFPIDSSLAEPARASSACQTVTDYQWLTLNFWDRPQQPSR